MPPRRAVPPDPTLPRPGPASFISPGDYTTPFLLDAARAALRAPLVTLKALWWYVTRRRVRARNYVQEIVGRRLDFAIWMHLRASEPLPAASSGLRCAAIVPVGPDTPPDRVHVTLRSVPGGVDAIVAGAAEDLPADISGALALQGAAGTADLVNGAARGSDHDVVLVLMPGNVLLPGALERILGAFADGTLAVFADEVLGLPGLALPLLKPDFDEDLLLQVDIVGEFLAVRREPFLARGGFSAECEGALARDFVLRLAEARGPGAIGHVTGPVHGRDLGVAPADPSTGLAAVTAHLARTGAAAVARLAPGGARIEVMRALVAPPAVSVIVPTRDGADLLRPCLDGLLRRTDYPCLEVIVADNGSRERATLDLFAAHAGDPRFRVVPMPGPFNFSRINNDAVALATGDVVVFMNNDVEPLDGGWLTAMVAEAVRPEIGAVGAKLLYPDRFVQHAGVVLGLRGGPAGHAFHRFRDGHPGYLHMLEATRRCSAVTGACLAVARAKFEAVGGFDQETFPVSLNDVDLCLRLDAAGYRTLHVPRACLLHKESASRPSDWRPDQRARYERELAAFRERWAERLRRDPWYNTGHGYAHADFSVPRWTDPSWPPC